MVSLQQFDHEALIQAVSSTVDVEMCLLLELCEAFIWAAISESVNCRVFGIIKTEDCSFIKSILFNYYYVIILIM